MILLRQTLENPRSVLIRPQTRVPDHQVFLRSNPLNLHPLDLGKALIKTSTIPFFYLIIVQGDGDLEILLECQGA